MPVKTKTANKQNCAGGIYIDIVHPSLCTYKSTSATSPGSPFAPSSRAIIQQSIHAVPTRIDSPESPNATGRSGRELIRASLVEGSYSQRILKVDTSGPSKVLQMSAWSDFQDDKAAVSLCCLVRGGGGRSAPISTLNRCNMVLGVDNILHSSSSSNFWQESRCPTVGFGP